MPLIPFQDYAVVGDGDIMAIDGVGVQALVGFGAGFEVDDELVAIKIEVHPLIGAATFFAAEDIAIELSCGIEVIYGNSYVKWSELLHFFWLIRQMYGFM